MNRSNQPRSVDYPFTLIEIRFNKEGVGVGKMSVRTKITITKDKQTHRARELRDRAGPADRSQDREMRQAG